VRHCALLIEVAGPVPATTANGPPQLCPSYFICSIANSPGIPDANGLPDIGSISRALIKNGGADYAKELMGPLYDMQAQQNFHRAFQGIGQRSQQPNTGPETSTYAGPASGGGADGAHGAPFYCVRLRANRYGHGNCGRR